MTQQERIRRVDELGRKAKAEGLTEAESEERMQLFRACLIAFRDAQDPTGGARWRAAYRDAVRRRDAQRGGRTNRVYRICDAREPE